MIVRHFVMGAVVLAFVAAGCGGGGISLEEYLTQMDELQASFEQAGVDLQIEVETAMQGVTTNEEALTVFKGFLEESLVATDELVGELEALDPPGEAESQHGDFVNAGRALRGALADVIDRYDEFGSVDEISQFFTNDLADVEQQGTEACIALQTVADDNDIAVDMGCG